MTPYDGLGEAIQRTVDAMVSNFGMPPNLAAELTKLAVEAGKDAERAYYANLDRYAATIYDALHPYGSPYLALNSGEKSRYRAAAENLLDQLDEEADDEGE